MSKHTPGPWYMDARCSIWRRPISDLYENGGEVVGDNPLATVWKGWYGEGEQCFPVVANARLIAAAPDLLEAAERVVERWDSPHWGWSDEHTSGLIHQLRAAIAKAKREQP